jgi:RNA polymerase sigma factor (sigma-70 family)
MAATRTGAVIRHLRAVLRPDGAGRTDGQLLTSFIDHNDAAAFEALVRRHGPMVFGVCRRVARDHHDAEDAFQASFLVLARRATAVRPRDRVAGWLHGVALRTARKARAMAAKRRRRERPVAEVPEPQAAPPDPGRELRPLIDRELSGLPENDRLAVLLCDLEGLTIKAAALRLGWPQGTLAGRLARGRRRLARRLARRGVGPSAALAALAPPGAASAGVPAALTNSMAKAAALVAAGQAAVAGAVPAEVAALMEGVLKSMMRTKLSKAAGLGVAVLCLCGLGAGGFQALPAQQTKAPAAATAPPAADAGRPTADPRLEGTWRLVRVEEGGKAVAPEQAAVTFAGGRYTEGELTGAYTTAVDPTGERNELDVTFTNGAFKGRTFYYSYRVEGDRLHWASATIPLAEHLRAMTFTAPAGAPTRVMVLQRVKAP